MIRPSEVVLAGYGYCPAKNGVFSVKSNQLMHETHVCASEGIRLQVSEVSSMCLLALGTAVALVFGVEMLTNMFCWISILIDMHTVFAIRIQTLN